MPQEAQQEIAQTDIKIYIYIYIIEVQLTYSVLGAQKSDSVIHTHVYYLKKLFSIVSYYTILTVVPCAIQLKLTFKQERRHSSIHS